MKGRALTPRDLARRLMTAHGDDRSTAARYGAVRHTVLALSQWIGPNALDALLNRAVVQTVVRHSVAPDLRRILRTDDSAADLKRLSTAHGEESVNAALEALLIALLELLSRLIGDEMSSRIIEISPTSITQRRGKKSR